MGCNEVGWKMAKIIIETKQYYLPTKKSNALVFADQACPKCKIKYIK